MHRVALTAPPLAASIIVPTRNRSALLRLTIPRIISQSIAPSSWELIVVDDGSTRWEADAGADVVQDCGHPNVRFLRQPHGGASRARNAAIAVARGRTLVFVDDDAFVGPHFLASHLTLQDGAGALVAGGIVQVRTIPGTIDERPSLRGYHRHPMPGGNSSAPAAEVRAVGGFDPWFSAYGWQDQELAQRLLRRGLIRRFAWRAPIYHFKPPTYDVDLRSQVAREEQRGCMGARFYRKHPSLQVAITTKCWPPLGIVIAVLCRCFAIDALRSEVAGGEIDGAAVAPWRAALLRARVESLSGRRELARLAALSAGAPEGWRVPTDGREAPDR